MSSTDNVVRFDRPEPEPEPESAGFAQTRDAWLSRWHSDRRLTHSERVICSRMNQYFNREHFERTDGDLLAWPSWQTLMDETGMSKTSVYERLRNLERLGAFEVDHGRYDDKTKKRAGNRYLVRKSKVHSAEPCRGDQGSASRTNQGSASRTNQGSASRTNQGSASRTNQGSASRTNQGSASRTRLDESDSVIKKEGNSKNGNSRGPSAPEKESKPSSTDSPESSSPLACEVPRPRSGWRERLDEKPLLTGEERAALGRLAGPERPPSKLHRILPNGQRKGDKR
jgi:hypothetical protein